MRPDLTMRSGTPADGECLSALGSQTWLHTYATDGIRSTIARFVQEHLSPAAFRLQLERSDAFTLVAVVNGHLVGYAIVEIGKPCLVRSTALTHLDKLFVQEHFLGTGIGHALLEEVKMEARRRAGSSALWLTVNSGNERAQVFYARHGFVDIGSTKFDLYGEQHENRILHAPDS
jgi:GNAT superfamily N-acetyltransferase